jgi:hypothetical protein
MNIATTHIRIRMMLPLLVLMITTLIAMLFGGYRLHNHHVDSQAAAKLQEVGRIFDQLLEKETDLMDAQLDFIQEDRELLSAWQQRDRGALLRIASPTFERIKTTYGTTHFYFIDPDQICFLRVHAPGKNGDAVNRHSLTEAVATQDIQSGIELGPLGTFTLRTVHPWFHLGELVGYIELGMEIEHLTPSLKQTSGLDLVFTIDKFHLNRDQWEEGVKFLGKNDTWQDFDEFVVISATLTEVSPVIRDILQQHYKINLGTEQFSAGNRTFRLASAPLTNAGHEEVGVLFTLYDITREAAFTNKLVATNVSAVLAIVALLFLFLFSYSGRLGETLQTYQDDLEGLVAARTNELQSALDEIEVLSGFLAICSSCKRIRDQEGNWNPLETYISEHSDAEFTHGICPQCRARLYPELS